MRIGLITFLMFLLPGQTLAQSQGAATAEPVVATETESDYSTLYWARGYRRGRHRCGRAQRQCLERSSVQRHGRFDSEGGWRLSVCGAGCDDAGTRCGANSDSSGGARGGGRHDRPLRLFHAIGRGRL